MSIGISGIDITQAVTNTITSGTTLTSSYRTVLCDSSSASFTVTLPPSSNSKYMIYTIKKIDATGNTVTVDANASELIDGSLTKILNSQYLSVTIQCDGSNWYII
jgi:hypothetical protein